MLNQLQKAINLAKITGDKIIVIDSAKPDSVFVIMGLEEYEKFVLGQNELRNLTEDELLDRINRDIAIWKSENDERSEGDKEFPRGERRGERRKEMSPYFRRDLGDLESEDDEEIDFDESEEDMYYYEEPFGGMEDDGPAEDDFHISGKSMEEIDEDKNKFGNNWEIPPDIKSSAEEVVKDVPF
ncbi:MAG: hypothetical protein PHQ42_01500 [Patescibacteria group bacterium]|nr:hypothetical protein [Patescibacteria group bacterium]